MKLRHQLLMFSTAQLVVFGVLFALAYGALERKVLPMFEHLLEAKAVEVARSTGSALDVALGADDRVLMAAEFVTIGQDPDFRYAEVRDAHAVTVFSIGATPAATRDPGPPLVTTAVGHELHAWAPVSLEGMQLGSVTIVFSTARLDELDTWARRIGLGVGLLWLLALGYSILFARSFVTPIHTMMAFSRKVAGGGLAERLTITPPGELGELCDSLNQMTAYFERRAHDTKLAGERAETMQRELLSVLRRAGMAEIANGVLHNVGNVLNSLNVSVSLIGDQARTSRVGALTKSVELFDGFPGGLPAFLATDKGKLLPGYLASVSKRLVDENATMLAELDSVARNVDHIKAIVAMQQSYSRPNGISEPVVIGELIDDALRMGESSFAKHGIEVVKDYGTLAPVSCDRHKLLQILINLISNARHALKDGAHAADRLTVRVRATATHVAIVVEDTGIGIPPENLEKIFQHGFTTKAGGHGFGLHASANATREMGGRLSIVSDGPGRGATVTLELPIEPESHGHDHN
ncbi:hypothetical protein BH11MYX1_BH11MYX1_36910 [soil metagenome]